MATLKEQYPDDLDMFMETGLPWVDQAIFTPHSGDPVTLNVQLTIEEYNEPEDLVPSVSGRAIRVKALYADIGKVPVGKTSNMPGEKFLIDSQVYEVIEIAERDRDWITCAVREL